ncbi:MULTISPECIES: SdpI family protein [Staphylococcus]|nr:MULTISPECIES: SdpI family protein [Staphylococcus]MDK9844707.1 SdpI family protein [Staphylococcus equorum]MDK9858735.1 SdpI family protein [Staphylococcus equorum]MDK9875795.1 SdpI family protein [Staphylococcus equorum]MDN6572270.1 SdpI family protein [Staphylococcus equorum]MDN6612589.1 SdpI family protein [Staphylococcus equorum]
MKEVLRQSKISLVIIILAIITWLIALPFLPNSIPMQYNSNGDVNWSANKFLAFIIMIGIMIFCYIITNIKIYRDQNQTKFSNVKFLNQLLNPLIHGFIYLISVVMILSALGQSISVEFLVPIFVGILLMIVGNYLPTAPRNGLFGIKNKWARSNEIVWKKTQRFSSRIYIVVGFVLLLLGIFNIISSIITISLCIILVLLPLAYSYYMYQKVV